MDENERPLIAKTERWNRGFSVKTNALLDQNMTLQYDDLKITCQPYNQTNAKREPAIPSCQICGKRGHAAIKRFNQSYTPDDIPNALAAVTISNRQDLNGFLTLVLQPT